MIQDLRARFNESFRSEQYVELLGRLEEECGTPVGFRNSETPIFLESTLLERLAREGEELIRQLVEDPGYRAASDASLPARYAVANEDVHPLFVQVDFGLNRDLEPKLVEIQGFPSLYAYQPVLAELHRAVYDLDSGLRHQLTDDYADLFRKAVLGDHRPQDVVLLEIDPFDQKTLADFLITRRDLGIRIVNIRDVRQDGRKLMAPDGPIERVYNRTIIDELERKGVELNFDWTADLDVEWAGHPNWYFRISKFSLPYLNHRSVPRTYFVKDLTHLPDDPENWVLKPLYSFAGMGVIVGPTREDIERVSDPAQYILQERVDFAPLIETPHGPTKAEIRMMYIWTDQLRPVTTIVRMGRGKMMGVDHNKNMQWVGGSVAFWK
jgi:hypothetical protein